MHAHVNQWVSFSGKNVLLLQGPVGRFFNRVANHLYSAGCGSVSKVNFNGGDAWFYTGPSVNFRASPSQWPQFCENFMTTRRIHAIMLFGDCRPVHKVAIAIAQRLGVEVWVFEEGYVRPNHITLERGGVNGFSQLPKDRAFYDQQAHVALKPEQAVGPTFAVAAWQAVVYYTVAALGWPLFGHYQHHRWLSMLDGLLWCRSLYRKWYYGLKESGVQDRLVSQQNKAYFLVVLQASLDQQILVHSPYNSVLEFMEEVVDSFAQYAPQDCLLVLKHHPMDRGYTDYTADMQRLTAKHGLQGRALYIHDQHLPTLLSHARGVVVVNSTVGLSAIDHATPVKVLGDAIYDVPGLTFQGPLQEFWVAAQAWAPDMDLHAKFRNYVIAATQLNGSVYKPLPGASGSGTIWPIMENIQGYR